MERINYTNIFSPISMKDSLCVILTLVAYFNLELHQMDIKMIFLIGEIIYIKQLEIFFFRNGEHLVCKLNKSIYGLK